MSDARLQVPGVAFALTSAIVGRVEIGAGTIRVDEAAVTIIRSSARPGEDDLRVGCDSIARIVGAGRSVTLVLLDGTTILLMASDDVPMGSAILGACRTIPELTRGLRAMGSSRRGSRGRASAVEYERRYFAPFLVARRASLEAESVEGAISAFSPTALIAALDANLAFLATERAGKHLARWRAIESELSEFADPVRVALLAIGPLAASALAGDLMAWRAWAAHLRSLFEAADRAWIDIDGALSREPVVTQVKR